MAPAGVERGCSITPERYKQIGDLYHAALELEASRKEDILAQACASDEDLRLEVESLLAFHEQAGKFIETPALNVAARALAGDLGGTWETIKQGHEEGEKQISRETILNVIAPDFHDLRMELERLGYSARRLDGQQCYILCHKLLELRANEFW